MTARLACVALATAEARPAHGPRDEAAAAGSSRIAMRPLAAARHAAALPGDRGDFESENTEAFCAVLDDAVDSRTPPAWWRRRPCSISPGSLRSTAPSPRPGPRTQAPPHHRGGFRPFDARAGARPRRNGTEIVAIDPAPRADIADLPGVRIVASTLQAAPLCLCSTSLAGRPVVHRPSHILMPGSDVDILLNRVLPISAGRRAGAHSRRLPALRLSADLGWRAYNEQQASRRCW